MWLMKYSSIFISTFLLAFFYQIAYVLKILFIFNLLLIDKILEN